MGRDDELPSDDGVNNTDQIRDVWKDWFTALHLVEQVRVPRWLGHSRDNDKPPVLHVFTDASTKAFGVVVYSRVERGGVAQLAFVMSKARIAPLKGLSVPRLELQEILVGARLTATAAKELEIDPKTSVLWSDSQTALQWLRQTSGQLKAFIASRVTEVLELTEARQWRHVPGRMNPADLCSRGCMPEEFVADEQWLVGPFFLRCPESSWPADIMKYDHPPCEIQSASWVLAAHVNGSETSRTDEFPMVRLFNRRSSWIKIMRVTPWVFRAIESFRENARRRKGIEMSKASLDRRNLTEKLIDLVAKAPPLEPSELSKAKTACIRLAQRVSYAQELTDLTRNSASTVRKTSSLLKLAPFVDEYGLLRVGGRLDKSELPTDSKHPMVLHPDNILTERIVWHEHEKYHARPERLLADIRSTYWIVAGRRAVRRITNRCFKCKRLFSQPVVPMMADLPSDRLAAYKHPFANTGVDYFGPLRVKIGRRVEKR